MPRVISSAQTFISKFILPFVIAALVAYAFSRTGIGFLTPFFIPIGVILVVSVYWFQIRLKKVAIDSDGLVISNYVREVRVPWRDVSQVKGNRWEKTRQVTITFNRDIGFGTSVVFMPRFRLMWPYQEHPIAQELRNMILVHRGERFSPFP
ncbi:MAG: hypothetical protein ABI833_11200 [Acidobacteriota bacterium]